MSRLLISSDNIGVKRLRTPFAMMLMISLASRADDAQYFYVIKKNDIISSILERAAFLPIYGKKGSLILVKQLNAANIANLDKIRPGQKIYLPSQQVCHSRDRGMIFISKNNRVSFSPNLETLASKISHRKNLAKQLSFESQRNSINRSPAQVLTKASADLSSSVLSHGKNEVPQSELPLIEKTIQGGKNAGEDDSITRGEFLVSVSGGFERIDATLSSNGATALLLSDLIQRMRLQYSQVWNDSFSTFTRFETSKLTFKQPLEGSLLLANSTKSKIGLGLMKDLSASSSLRAEIGSQEDIYVNTYSTASATLQVFPALYLESIYSFVLVNKKRLQLKANLGFNVTARSNFGSLNSNGFTRYLSQIQITQDFRDYILFTEMEYSNGSAKTNVSKQLEQELFVTFGLKWPLGGTLEKVGP